MKKKLVTMVLTSMMAVALVACGSTESKETPTTTVAPTEAAPEVTEAPQETVTPEETVAPQETATPEPTKAPEYAKGTLLENGFESEWLNLRFTTPANTTMYTQEQLDEAMKQTQMALNGGTPVETLDYNKLNVVAEMVAMHADGTQLFVQVEALSMLASALTEEAYLEVSFQNMVNNEQITIDEEAYEAIVGGEKYLGKGMTLDMGAGMVSRQEVMVRKIGNRMVVINLYYAESAAETAKMMLNCCGSYDSEPIVFEETTESIGTVVELPELGLKFSMAPNMVRASEVETEEVLLFAQRVDGMIAINVSKASLADTPDIVTAEDFANKMRESAAEGTTYEENVGTVEIGGQEYALIKGKIDQGGMIICQDYAIQIKDGVVYAVAVAYMEGLEAEAQEIFNAFSAY